MNSDIKVGEHDLLSFIRPDTLIGALAYLVIFVARRWSLSRALRAASHASVTRSGHIDRTTVSFLQQMMGALIWAAMLIRMRTSSPALRLDGHGAAGRREGRLGRHRIRGAEHFGNLVAGMSITIYRPFVWAIPCNWPRRRAPRWASSN